jgi:ERCC4-type nuclease
MPQNAHDIHIVADDRERGCEVAECLAAMDGVHLRIGRLSMGDYRLDDAILFERKTLNDFAASVVDGRLFRQAVRLAGSKFRCALILEGTKESLTRSGFRRESMQGALIAVSLVLGIPVLRSRDCCETARLMVYAARQVRAAARGAHYRAGYRPKGKWKRQLYILQGLPGVGPERAARLLDRFGCVEAVVGAGSEALQSVEGIGKHTADKIRWAVREQGQTYG